MGKNTRKCHKKRRKRKYIYVLQSDAGYGKRAIAWNTETRKPHRDIINLTVIIMPSLSNIECIMNIQTN